MAALIAVSPDIWYSGWRNTQHEVIGMSLDILQNILAEEKLADKAVLDAQKSANETVKNAESAVLDQERKAAVGNRALHQKLLDDRRAQVERELAGRRQEGLKRMENLIGKAAGNLPEAVEYILGEVLDGRR